MAKGVYFIEPNQNIISDFEGYFMLNPSLTLIGNSGLLSQALTEICSNPAVDIIIIAESMIDGDCVTALKQLSTHSATKIVTINAANEMLQQQIRSLGGIVLMKPYTYSDLDTVLSRDVTTSASVPEESILNNPISEAPQTPIDNPYIEMAIPKDVKNKPDDIKEKLRQVRRAHPMAQSEHLLPQQVIAIHNQKGGVGKTTLAKELAVAIHRFGIVKNGQTHQPKVCLCDFDLDASDVISVLNLPPKPNISDWYNALTIESQRIGVIKGTPEPVENIRFTEKQIMENFLIRHETGIYVLAAPESKKESTEIHKEDIRAIINNLRACSFDIIILDTGPNILDYTLTSLIEADTILAVSTCEFVSAKRLNSIIQDIVKIPGCNPSKIKLVVNMYDRMCNIAPQELVDVLNLELMGVIPKFDEMGNINNEAYSVFYNKVAKDKKANLAYAEAINRLARKVTHVDEMSSSVRSADMQQSETKKKRGFWHRLFG